MTRRVLLLDVTAMAGDNVCVAGIDVDSGAQIRLADPQPTRRMIARWGFAPYEVISVDCKPLRRRQPPHVEDCKWNERLVRKHGPMPFSEVCGIAGKTAFRSIDTAFGAAMVKSARGNPGFLPGAGERSLATLAVRNVRSSAAADGKLRTALRDEHGDYLSGVPFQDLAVRVHESGCDACGEDYIGRIKADFDADACLVRVGLTRGYPARPEDAPACWLQVTNILARPRAHF